ncbi:MAG: Mov34/MPN/PAD-1 family protein [Myxococcales bacterium]|nr:Mov34/MPN/PAD-1 family protein [Myxococcales bacterium]
MSRRIEVDENLEPVEIPGRILNELCSHALETLPEECCGLIVGSDQRRYGELRRCRNEMTSKHRADPVTYPRTGEHAFYMNELDYLRVQETAHASSERVTVVYHSHVGAGAYLSEMDLEYAENAFFPFPDSDQLVVAVCNEKVAGIGLFSREGDGQAFRGRSIILGTP